MNKSALVIASTIALFAIFITGTQSSIVFAQIQSTQSAINQLNQDSHLNHNN